jgi:hypothetical protein
VGEDQRERLWFRRPDVDEVDVLTVDLGGEVRKLVEFCLVLAPVVTGAPVLGQFLEPRQREAVVPPGVGDLVGPAGAGESVGRSVRSSRSAWGMSMRNGLIIVIPPRTVRS